MILYHIGATLKDLGKKWFAFSRINESLPEILSNWMRIRMMKHVFINLPILFTFAQTILTFATCLEIHLEKSLF
jgi:hypothetical protein